MFAVVEFENVRDDERENFEVAIVPVIWLYYNDRKCYWPNRIGRNDHSSFVRECVKPKSTWQHYRVRQVHYKMSYEKADDFLSELLRDNKNEQRFSTETVRSISIKPLSNLDENESSSSNDEAIHTKSLTSNHKGSTFSQSVRPVSSMSVIASTNTPPSPASTSSIDRHDSITSAENTVILTCLAKISTEINQHTAILNELLRNSRNNGTAIIVKPPEAPDFPITAVDDFKRFDKNLRTNINLRKYMVSRLSSLGGSGCEGLCRRILKFLITDNVAVCYNWKGKNAKMPFEKTCSMEVIYESVKLHFPQTEKSDFVTAETTKNWLKYAKSRQVKKLQEKCEKNVEESS